MHRVILISLFLLVGCSSAHYSTRDAALSDSTAADDLSSQIDESPRRTTDVATEHPDVSGKIPLDPAIRTGRLDNGLFYMIRENSRPENRAELRLVLDVGSILEEDDQRGLAHFAEHMAFNGTKHFEKQALVEYLESIGMRFGPDINAYTSFDETVYRFSETGPVTCPSIRKKSTRSAAW